MKKHEAKTQKRSTRVISLLLCAAMMFSLCGCMSAYASGAIAADDVQAMTLSADVTAEVTSLEGEVIVETTAPETDPPVEETTAPVEETTAPAEETTAPVEETTAPVTETTEPAAETTDPVVETTEPAAETPAAVYQELTAHSGDETTPEADRLTVTVKGVLPQGAYLTVTPIVEQEKVDEVSAKLEEHDYQADGFLPYDITLHAADGTEIEPDDSVTVSFVLGANLLAEQDITAEELTVLHLVEDEQGQVTNVADVIANDSAAVVDVKSDKVVEATFETESFSTFTITWRRNNSSTYITLDARDSDGNELTIPSWETNGGTTVTLSSNSGTTAITTITAPTVTGYTFTGFYLVDGTELNEMSTANTLYFFARRYSQVWTRYYSETNSTSTASATTLPAGATVRLVYAETLTADNIRWTTGNATYNLNNNPYNGATISAGFYVVGADGAVLTPHKNVQITTTGTTYNEVAFDTVIDAVLTAHNVDTELNIVAEVYLMRNGQKYAFTKASWGAWYVYSGRASGEKGFGCKGLGTLTGEEGVKDGDQFYISLAQSVDPIQTVDSNADGITLKLFNYSSAINFDGRALSFYSNGGAGVDGSTSKSDATTKSWVNNGLVQNVLGSNGFPTTSSGTLFANRSLDYLFSTTDAAKGVTAYDTNYLFTKDASGYYEYNSGTNAADYDATAQRFYVYPYTETAYLATGFYPFNSAQSASQSGGANALFQGGVSGSLIGGFKYTSAVVDYWFGMSMETAFSQPKDGKVSGNDMVFEFSGDDDVWVFLDGVLVMDIGGIHGVVSGTINFATGAVVVNGVSTTIKQCFENAGKADDYTWDGNTFADYTDNITMSYFYMERGGGASNCHIKFNMPTVPNGTLRVQKQVEGETVDGQTYIFQLTKKSDGTAVANATYTLSNGTTGTTDAEGKFVLTAGQYADFTATAGGTIAPESTYVVTEVGVGKDSLDNYVTTIVGSGETTTKDIYIPAAGSAAVTFLNTRRMAAATVTKTFVGITASQIPSDFAITVVDGDGNQFAVLTLTDGSAVSSNEGLTYTWSLTGLDIGEEYTLSESGYAVDGFTCVPTADQKFTATLNGNNTASFTNTYAVKYGIITINKRLDKAATQDATFLFEITGTTVTGKTATYYAQVTVAKGQTTGTTIIEDVYYGTYDVTELDSINSTVGDYDKTVTVSDGNNNGNAVVTANNTYDGHLQSDSSVAVNRFTYSSHKWAWTQTIYY